MADVYVASEAEKIEPKANEEKAPAQEDRQPDPEWKKIIDDVLKEAGEYPRRELFGAYHVRPKERFVTQQDDEEIVLLLRAHPITNLGWFLVALIMLAAPTVLDLSGMFVAVPMKYMFVGKMTWYLMTWAYSFERFLHWYYSLFLVTNERIIDIDFYNLMLRVVTHVNLNHIEEPVMKQQGFGPTVFNHGFVMVQTAGEVVTVECAAAPWPEKVVRIINLLSEDLEKRRERGE